MKYILRFVCLPILLILNTVYALTIGSLTYWVMIFFKLGKSMLKELSIGEALLVSLMMLLMPLFMIVWMWKAFMICIVCGNATELKKFMKEMEL